MQYKVGRHNGGGVLIVMHGRGDMAIFIETLASLRCRVGARRVFTDQADIACTKRKAP